MMSSSRPFISAIHREADATGWLPLNTKCTHFSGTRLKEEAMPAAPAVPLATPVSPRSKLELDP
jgi:hypothetical protein